MSNLNDEDNQEKKVDPLKKEDEKELSAEEKLKNAEEKLLRTLAELENQRKRFDKEIKDAIDFGGFSFAKENLVILDNLQRAYISIKEDPVLKVNKDIDKLQAGVETAHLGRKKISLKAVQFSDNVCSRSAPLSI